MHIQTLLIDLDDTIYPPRDGIWDAIGTRINSFIHNQIHLPPEQISQLRDRLYLEYGTTLRGLQIEYGIDPHQYLDYVHDIPLKELLTPNPRLQDVFSNLPQRKIIFTNSDRNHSTRVLDFFNIRPYFERIIDVLDVAPYCKPNPEAFEAALRIAGVSDLSACAIVDDNVRNIQAAAQMGLFSVHVGPPEKAPAAAHRSIARIEDLPAVLQNQA
ncbi:hypothetical protein ADN00_04675 [Ornatilinea apprima]|uniref:Pyrimidine 5'-nucleotidase n=1 Tax=Ornatilinea apprima TaxID=1134406 RepID=A0A0P6YB56_9CHLR|nr:pyrimidine 5'-nucleotidase [Ornatilinea apprima]KPL79152.1 hypothetical protein ADN00_04675 [Ornatilinea apprima]